MPPRSRSNRQTSSGTPTVRQVGDWLDIGRHSYRMDPYDDEDTEALPTLLRISSIKAVTFEENGEDDDGNQAYKTMVYLKGNDEEYQFGPEAFELIRRRVMGANPAETTAEAPQENS